MVWVVERQDVVCSPWAYDVAVANTNGTGEVLSCCGVCAFKRRNKVCCVGSGWKGTWLRRCYALLQLQLSFDQ